jgi:hypothetical protein
MALDLLIYVALNYNFGGGGEGESGGVHLFFRGKGCIYIAVYPRGQRSVVNRDLN